MERKFFAASNRVARNYSRPPRTGDFISSTIMVIPTRLNDLYKRYGSGVSLVRPDWKPRPDSSLMIDSVSPNSVDSISSSSKHQSGEDIEDERESNHSGSELDMAIDHIKQLSLVPRQIQFGKKAGSKSFHR